MNKFIVKIAKHSTFAEFLFLFLSIIALFLFSYHLTSLHAWNVPLGYGGDLYVVMGNIQAYMTGEIPFLGHKFVDYLNAPFIANWNDYPITEDIIFYFTGLLARFIGLYPATNFLLLLSHLLAGISFWVVCKYYKVNPLLAFSGALAFAFSHFIFIRGLGHIVVGFCWHIPLLLMAVEWLYTQDETKIYSKRFYCACGISFIAGILNPYYSIMYCMLLVFSVLFFYFNKRYIRIKFPAILISITALSFLIVNIDTISYGLLMGSNSAFSGRNLPSLELYALKLPDMFFAPGGGTWFTDISRFVYYDRAYVKGEYWSPYLGFFGIFSFGVFYLVNSINAIKGKLKLVSVHYWNSIWIILFSIIGGINLIFGIAGFTFLRATNRLSIFILVIVTIFTLRFLTKYLPSKAIIMMSVLILYSVWYEQLAPRIKSNPPIPNAIEQKLSSDREFINKVEQSIPGGNIFLLPVMKFPEVGPINLMPDYEPFRLILNSSNLNYSYGSNKGRGDSEWQYEIQDTSPEQMISTLQGYGFDSIIVNRMGYDDQAKWLIMKLKELTTVIADSNDYISFLIKPAFKNNKPIIKFTQSWSDDEITHRWARKSRADIIATNFNSEDTKVSLTFELFSLIESEVKIYFNDDLVDVIPIPYGSRVQVAIPDTSLKHGKNIIRLESNRWPRRAGNGDTRRLTFGISNLNIQTKE